MPILNTVDSRTVRGRFIHLVIIVALSLGGLTMVYPFAVMISGSFRSEMDESQLNLLPSFWFDDATLYAKFLETKYNQDITALNRAHRTAYFEFQRVQPPSTPDSEAAARLQAWMQGDDPPQHWQVLGGIAGIKTTPENLRRLRDRLNQRFDGDLLALGRNLGAPVSHWGAIVLPVPTWTDRRFDHRNDAIYEEYFALLRERPIAERQLVSITGAFLERMIYPVDGLSSTAGFNRRHRGELDPIDSYAEFHLPATVPGEEQPVLRASWIEFVRQELNPSFILVRSRRETDYRQMLATTYGGIDQLNRAWGARYPSFEAIPLPAGEWLSGQQRQDYEAFLADRPAEDLFLTGPDYAWAAQSRSLTADRTGVSADPIATGATPPMADLEWRHVVNHATSLRWTFTIRNYIIVWDELVTQGNALANTFIFVTLSIVLALLVNPLAAYALSRYQLPGTYKILLFLMATMAFPPMVALIPQFILLQKLNLFNTYAALVLPLIVNGYMIFLLKGFFDSLPRELYEAARIDGAGELRMFFVITLALSKPILAVLALGTFTASYMMFLYPLLVAPDQDMWLISVWLYQFQREASTSAVFASVVVASVPTLVVFLFVQRTIMRGIVVPTEK